MQKQHILLTGFVIENVSLMVTCITTIRN